MKNSGTGSSAPSELWVNPRSFAVPGERRGRVSLLRIFRDYYGREWEVRMMGDEELDSVAVASDPALALGALVFDLGDARRRLSPVPPGWYIASDALLSRWCEGATALPPHCIDPRKKPGD